MQKTRINKDWTKITKEQTPTNLDFTFKTRFLDTVKISRWTKLGSLTEWCAPHLDMETLPPHTSSERVLQYGKALQLAAKELQKMERKEN